MVKLADSKTSNAVKSLLADGGSTSSELVLNGRFCTVEASEVVVVLTYLDIKKVTPVLSCGDKGSELRTACPVARVGRRGTPRGQRWK